MWGSKPRTQDQVSHALMTKPAWCPNLSKLKKKKKSTMVTEGPDGFSGIFHQPFQKGGESVCSPKHIHKANIIIISNLKK